MFRLRGSLGEIEVVLPLAVGLNSIGSAPSNRLILDSDGVSRHHAVVIVEGQRVLITDQESKNGTFLNQRRIRQGEASVGDAVSFGPVALALEQIDPDDARLAVEIPVDPHGVAQPATAAEISTASHRLSGDRNQLWVTLIRRFLEQLVADPQGNTAPALTLLVRELTVLGACLVKIGGERGPAVVAAAGRVDGPCLAQVESSWLIWQKRRGAPGQDPDRAFFLSHQQVTCLAVRDPSEDSATPTDGVALVIQGDFRRRERSQPFLHVLISLYRHWRPERLHDFPTAAPEQGSELRFPDGYVRPVSTSMTALEAQMLPLTQGDLPVLITGETGVGKELLAETLHLSSARRKQAFVAINCAAIPADLLEAELFGIGERVATGVAGRRGKFQQAQGGTLFLDEIGEMPAELQAKLLRVLQEKRIEPLGAQPIAIDVRLVAATNADLTALMGQGRFRRDLFYRIAGFTLEVPPLRQRKEDIPLLVEWFLRRFSQEVGKSIRGITVRALSDLSEHDWPGNVRELEHGVRRLVYVCPPGQAIESTMLPTSIREGGQPVVEPTMAPPSIVTKVAAEVTEVTDNSSIASTSSPGTSSNSTESSMPSVAGWQDLDLEAMERMAVQEAIRRAGGNQVQAAKLLGISRHRLRRRMDRFGLHE